MEDRGVHSPLIDGEKLRVIDNAPLAVDPYLNRYVIRPRVRS